MRARIALREDYDAAQLRSLAKATRNAGQSRRLLALAEIYDGGSRTKAARGKSDCLDVRVSSFRSSSPEACVLIGNQSWLACRHEMPKQGADPPHGRQVPQASA